MNDKSKIIALGYMAVTSVTVIVMLTSSFVLLKSQYLPSFMLAQKYVLPLIVSAMTVVYFTFFEPERLTQKHFIAGIRAVMVVTFLIFSFYLFTLESDDISIGTLSVYASQWIATIAVSSYFLFFKKSEAAG